MPLHVQAVITCRPLTMIASVCQQRYDNRLSMCQWQMQTRVLAIYQEVNRGITYIRYFIIIIILQVILRIKLYLNIF